ncbi:hypothetical protein EGM88_06215 [Aureibaculum marinum]|uniref:Aerotolerance regulator N-terminal domain-containing protein n=1 Tax=Aureibaculum marinum TaxID=2487930 RepID=A0A3N4NR42_9FLAO|nr:BatA domain-containing protein [Aureibaculum marinum]RPD98781.1 hypothetical protein EGM88_06215 [Aureibaculum marinum]
MQFKHPELLYALFLLVIPVLIHLFQLRKFQKIPFTNVKFLKEVELQTRKSSRLKKFLVLCTRLLLFTALIFAFSQPFKSTSKTDGQLETSIYLDNSFSMQAKGKQGELLKRAVQDVLENTQHLENVNLYTNNNVFKNLSSKELRNTLLDIDYYPIKTNLSSIIHKINSTIKTSNSSNTIFLISDFQKHNTEQKVQIDTSSNYYISQLQPETTSNISIDSVYISEQNNEAIYLTATIKNYGNTKKNVSVSLYNNNILSGKSTVNIANKQSENIIFNIPNTDSFTGKLLVKDENLTFDNELFFIIDNPEKINVAAIGSNNTFLSKIYTNDKFNFTSTTLNNFDYNELSKYNLLILNELKTIPNSLSNALKAYSENGGNLVFIPAIDADLESYNNLFSSLNIGSLQSLTESEISVTTINFAHPLLKGVFERQITNFQYPKVKSSYNVNFNSASTIVDFENGKSFISQITTNKGKIYWLASSLSNDNSNFKNSPLIVPIFYNFGLYSHNSSQLYNTIGNLNTIEIPEKLSKDEVLHLVQKNKKYIPLQQINSDRVVITTEFEPNKSGFIKVLHNENEIGKIAYNYDRLESDLNYINVMDYFGNTPNINYSTDVKDAFLNLSKNTKTTSYWQWFLIASLLFIIIEILVLKLL